MKGLVLSAAIALTAMAPPIHAQFFGVPTVTFDPTQAAHVVQQIAKAEQTYMTSVRTMDNVINAYNLAQHMATAPSSLYSGYGTGLLPGCRSSRRTIPTATRERG